MPEERVGFKYRLWRIVESTPFEYFIMTLIVLNTILLMMKVRQYINNTMEPKACLKKSYIWIIFSPLQFHKQSSELKNNLWNRYRCMEIQMGLNNDFGPIVYYMWLYYDLYSNIWIFHRNFVFESMTCLYFPGVLQTYFEMVTQINFQSNAFIAYY